MGILGNLIYPDNPKLAEQLNASEDKLRQTNNLHNDLVNSYRLMGESTKSFDAYLMAIMSMHYYLVYTEEDLSDLPDEDLPALSNYWADTVESMAMDVLTVKMALDGFKAIKNGIGNLVKEGGIFNRTASHPAEASTTMESEINAVGLREPLLQQGEVASLTTESGPEAASLGKELGGEADAVKSAIGEESEITQSLEEISNTAGTAKEGAALAEEGAALGDKLMSGAAAALGPALLVITVVTEIISAIHAGQEHAKLKKAADQLDDAQKKLDKSVDDLKAVFVKLLNAAKKDIGVYNKLLPELKALEHSSMFDRAGFSVAGIQTYIDNMPRININNLGIEGYQAAAKQNLEEATDFIRIHATHDSKMTSVIKELKSHMRKKGLTTLDDNDPFLVEIADVEGVDLSQVQAYNKFRVFMAEYASVLLPYHKEIQDKTEKGKVPKSPDKITPAKPDPNFDPKPEDFKIPGLA
jgi:hypothetical protein